MLGPCRARGANADDSTLAVERHDPAGGVPTSRRSCERPMFKEVDLPGAGELRLAQTGHGTAASERDLAADEHVWNVREEAENGTCLPCRSGQLGIAVRKEVLESAFRSRTGREDHLLRDTATVDLRSDEAVVRAAEPGSHKHDVHGISVGEPPMLHSHGAGLCSAVVARLVQGHRGCRGGAATGGTESCSGKQRRSDGTLHARVIRRRTSSCPRLRGPLVHPRPTLHHELRPGLG
jgi:hypothetical protein